MLAWRAATGSVRQPPRPLRHASTSAHPDRRDTCIATTTLSQSSARTNGRRVPGQHDQVKLPKDRVDRASLESKLAQVRPHQQRTRRREHRSWRVAAQRRSLPSFRVAQLIHQRIVQLKESRRHRVVTACRVRPLSEHTEQVQLVLQRQQDWARNGDFPPWPSGFRPPARRGTARMLTKCGEERVPEVFHGSNDITTTKLYRHAVRSSGGQAAGRALAPPAMACGELLKTVSLFNSVSVHAVCALRSIRAAIQRVVRADLKRPSFCSLQGVNAWICGLRLASSCSSSGGDKGQDQRSNSRQRRDNMTGMKRPRTTPTAINANAASVAPPQSHVHGRLHLRRPPHPRRLVCCAVAMGP